MAKFLLFKPVIESMKLCFVEREREREKERKREFPSCPGPKRFAYNSMNHKLKTAIILNNCFVVVVVSTGKYATNVVYKRYSYLFLLSLLNVIIEWSPLLDN